MIITIDGKAGVGKSAVANYLSKKLNYKHISMGIIIRGITWCKLNNVNYQSSNFKIIFGGNGEYPKVLFSNCDITDKLYGDIALEEKMSEIGGDIEYQQYAVNLISKYNKQNIIVEGRNTSEIFQNADYCFYLDASKGEIETRNLDLYRDISNSSLFFQTNCKRNDDDITREVGRLALTSKHCYIDTSKNTFEETTNEIMYKIANFQNDSILVSVVIVSYGRDEYLNYCINHIINQDLDAGRYEIIIVTDNANLPINNEENIIFIEIKNISELGVGYGRNKGLNIANGKYIIFIDSDIIVNTNFLNTHISYHKKNNNTIVLGSRRHLPKGVYTVNEINSYKKDSREILIRYYSQDINYLKYPWSICYSCNVSLPIELAKKALFDESYHGWGLEDIDWGYRLNEYAVSWIYSQNASGYHLYHDRSMNELKFLQWKKNLKKFCEKYSEIAVHNFAVFSSVFDPYIKSDYMDIYQLFDPNICIKCEIIDLCKNSTDFILKNMYLYLYDNRNNLDVTCIFIISDEKFDEIIGYSRYFYNLNSYYRVFTVNEWKNAKNSLLKKYNSIKVVHNN